MTYRLFHRDSGFVKPTPKAYRERSSGSGTGTRVCLDLGPATLRMSRNEALALADMLVDATESNPRPHNWLRGTVKPKLNRGNHAVPTPATPVWTSASTDYNHPDQSKED